MYDNLEGKKVLCCSNAYEQMYYLNDEFERLPEEIKNELKIMSVIFTEDVGGIMTLAFDEDGNLSIDVMYDEGDLLFDEIGCGLKVKQIQNEKRELMEALEMFYKVFFLGEDFEGEI